MDISNSWMINLEDHPGTLPGKNKLSCNCSKSLHSKSMQKIYENMELTYVSYVSFNEVFKNTWMVFTMEPHPPKKHGTPKETMEPPKSTRIMGKSSTTPRYPWENHTPNPSKFHVEFERLNMIQLYKHIMVLTHIYI